MSDHALHVHSSLTAHTHELVEALTDAEESALPDAWEPPGDLAAACQRLRSLDSGAQVRGVVVAVELALPLWETWSGAGASPAATAPRSTVMLARQLLLGTGVSQVVLRTLRRQCFDAALAGTPAVLAARQRSEAAQRLKALVVAGVDGAVAADDWEAAFVAEAGYDPEATELVARAQRRLDQANGAEAASRVCEAAGWLAALALDYPAIGAWDEAPGLSFRAAIGAYAAAHRHAGDESASAESFERVRVALWWKRLRGELQSCPPAATRASGARATQKHTAATTTADAALITVWARALASGETARLRRLGLPVPQGIPRAAHNLERLDYAPASGRAAA